MTLTKEQCLNIKGIGMIFIMIHNFVLSVFLNETVNNSQSQLTGVECNEMYYSQEATDFFLNHIFSSSFIWYFFAFAGWVGVSLFFFMSGYSLSKKYGKQRIEYFPYIKRHAVKLWKLLLPVYLLYLLVSHFCFGQEYQIKGIIAVAALIGNFFADSFFEPGVYWFFGAIFQFYILFLFMRHFETRWLVNILLLFVLMYYYILYLDNEYLSLYFRYTFRGWVIPFVMGMLYARKDFSLSKKQYLALFLVSTVALAFCLVAKPLAPFVDVLMIVSAVSFVQMRSYRLISFIGVISASVFVIHPFVRMIFLNTYCSTDSSVLGVETLIYVIITILLSWCHNHALKAFNNLSS